MAEKVPPSLVTILLAAGASRRMGEPKLFLEGPGGSMLRLAVEASLSLGHPLVVVTGAYERETREHLADYDSITYAHNPDWRSGMSASIAAGVKVARDLAPAGYLITLADQPGVGESGLRTLAASFSASPASIVATWYPERPGVPAIFPARHTEELLSGTGQSGARALIQRAGNDVRVIRFARPPEDIDTPEDYRRWIDA